MTARKKKVPKKSAPRPKPKVEKRPTGIVAIPRMGGQQSAIFAPSTRTALALQPAELHALQFEAAAPQASDPGPILEMTRPFGVVLRALVHQDGHVEFSLNATEEELERFSFFAFNTTSIEVGIGNALTVAEAVSRSRADAVLRSQGFYEVPASSTPSTRTATAIG